MKVHSILTTDFPEWKALQRLRAKNFRPKKENQRLVAVAAKWLPYPLRYYSYIVDGDAPFGEYHWAFCVELEQERRWNYREFREGFRFGKKGTEPWRNANPYKDQEPSRARSWDVGWVFGVHYAELRDQTIGGGAR